MQERRGATCRRRVACNLQVSRMGVQVCSHAGASAGACRRSRRRRASLPDRVQQHKSAGKSLARVDPHRPPVTGGEGSS